MDCKLTSSEVSYISTEYEEPQPPSAHSHRTIMSIVVIIIMIQARHILTNHATGGRSRLTLACWPSHKSWFMMYRARHRLLLTLPLKYGHDERNRHLICIALWMGHWWWLCCVGCMARRPSKAVALNPWLSSKKQAWCIPISSQPSRHTLYADILSRYFAQHVHFKLINQSI